MLTGVRSIFSPLSWAGLLALNLVVTVTPLLDLDSAVDDLLAGVEADLITEILLLTEGMIEGVLITCKD